MLHRPWMLGTVAVLTVASSAPGQVTLDREEAAAALREAEGLRSAFRIRMDRGYLEGRQRPEGQRIFVTLLQDGAGRERKEVFFPHQYRGMVDIVQVDMWDGELLLQEVYQAQKKESARHIVHISDFPEAGNDSDKVRTCLGLRFIHSARTPAEMLGEPDVEIEIREATVQGIPAVEVEYSRLPYSRAAHIIQRYDPNRQWLLLEQETIVYGGAGTETPDDDVLRFRERIVNGDVTQIGGVWMPGRFDTYTSIRPLGSTETQHYHTVTVFERVEVNPDCSDADFTLDIAALPLHSEIVDARVGATYRLGENILYMDGRLHEMSSVVTGPIEPEDFPFLQASATPILDPLALIAGKRTMADWLRLAGYGLLAAGVVGVVVVFFRHRWSGA